MGKTKKDQPFFTKRKRTRKKKAYIVLSKSRNYMYGAFPHTPDGYKMALDYVKKSKDEELYIKEK